MLNAYLKLPENAKFLYLQDAVQGKAAAKIAHFIVSDELYELAWSALDEPYYRKRIPNNKYIDLIIDTSAIIASVLSQTCDDAKQHLGALEYLERAFPYNIKDE